MSDKGKTDKTIFSKTTEKQTRKSYREQLSALNDARKKGVEKKKHPEGGKGL